MLKNHLKCYVVRARLRPKLLFPLIFIRLSILSDSDSASTCPETGKGLSCQANETITETEAALSSRKVPLRNATHTTLYKYAIRSPTRLRFPLQKPFLIPPPSNNNNTTSGIKNIKLQKRSIYNGGREPNLLLYHSFHLFTGEKSESVSDALELEWEWNPTAWQTTLLL